MAICRAELASRRTATIVSAAVAVAVLAVMAARADSSVAHANILALMAEGRSNAGVAGELGISERTVEAASAQMFRKLGLRQSPDVNRRVLAVLTLLRQ